MMQGAIRALVRYPFLMATRRKTSTAFGPRLRELREGAGLTQSQLGERASMAYQTVAKYERGTSEPSWSVVLRLAKALGVTPDAFVGEGELW